MKVLLINPPYLKGFSRSSRSPAVTKSGTLYYPIFLSYLAGYLINLGHSVKLVDCIADDCDLNGLTEIIVGFAPQFIISDSSIPSGRHDAGFLNEIKKKFPDIYCILVGPYPT